MQLDHVLARGARLRDVRVGPRGPSDHLPVCAEVDLTTPARPENSC